MIARSGGRRRVEDPVRADGLRSLHEYNAERPRQALDMKVPAHVYPVLPLSPRKIRHPCDRNGPVEHAADDAIKVAAEG